jgi:enamine deaminase RidA (YjgF/YER057c/UK114 family)
VQKGIKYTFGNLPPKIHSSSQKQFIDLEPKSVIEKKLAALNLELKTPKPAVGNYLGCKQVGELLFASGRVSDLKGEIGSEINLRDAQKAARDTVLLILSIVKNDIKDLDRIIGLAKMQGFLRCSADFTELPQVLDGASDLLVELFGENGKHARTATGVAQLPFGAAMQLDIVFVIKI